MSYSVSNLEQATVSILEEKSFKKGLCHVFVSSGFSGLLHLQKNTQVVVLEIHKFPPDLNTWGDSVV